jgi:hypothetical protein
MLFIIMSCLTVGLAYFSFRTPSGFTMRCGSAFSHGGGELRNQRDNVDNHYY